MHPLPGGVAIGAHAARNLVAAGLSVVAVVKPGRVMFEIEGVTRELAETAMGLAAAKLGVKTKFVAREEAVTE